MEVNKNSLGNLASFNKKELIEQIRESFFNPVGEDQFEIPNRFTLDYIGIDESYKSVTSTAYCFAGIVNENSTEDYCDEYGEWHEKSIVIETKLFFIFDKNLKFIEFLFA